MEVKTSHFFACLDRLRLIQRWSLMRNIEKENLAEHSLQVAFVAQALAIIKNRFFGGEVNWSFIGRKQSIAAGIRTINCINYAANFISYSVLSNVKVLY